MAWHSDVERAHVVRWWVLLADDHVKRAGPHRTVRLSWQSAEQIDELIHLLV
jgi:hypothetical protein